MKATGMNRMAALGLVGAAAISAAGCTGLRQAVGAEKVAPDEFRVVTSAPLVVPPEFNLRPPAPGEARPQELDPRRAAQVAIFGESVGQSASDGERLLVGRAGAVQADPNVRDVIDAEEGDIAKKPATFADRVLGQPPADAARAATEQAAVDSVTGGKAVTIERPSRTRVRLPGM